MGTSSLEKRERYSLRACEVCGKNCLEGRRPRAAWCQIALLKPREDGRGVSLLNFPC